MQTAITATLLAGELKKPAGEEVERALATAVGLLDEALEDAFRWPPPAVVDTMVLRVARAAYEGDKRNGEAGTTQVGGQPTARAPRDPLGVVRDQLSRYVIGIA